MKEEFARQGDILFERVDKIPEGAKQLDHRIVARGEATGHTHTITAPGRLWEWNGEVFVEAPGEVMVEHQEHGVGTLTPGIWKVVHQEEPTPLGLRHVSD